MATSEEIVTENKIREDINHTSRIYILAELTSEEEILGRLRVVDDLCRKFRHSHRVGGGGGGEVTRVSEWIRMPPPR